MPMKGFPGAARWQVTLQALRRWMERRTPAFRPAFDPSVLSHLHGRLEVVRDRNGVAHVYAEREPDLYAALGVLQASERMLHLDALRHFGAGRLAGWLGNIPLPLAGSRIPLSALLDIDRFVLPLGFEAEAHRDVARLGVDDRLCLDAFVQGVNDVLLKSAGSLPGEYAVLPMPRPWTAEDCFLCARAMGLVTALLPLDNELLFDAVRRDNGDAVAKMLYPDAPWDQCPEVVGAASPEAGAMPAAAPDDETRLAGEGAHPAGEAAAPLHPAGIGSNNWAVSGRRTLSGKPLFCNDPHVPLFPAPTFWQHVHLCSGDVDVQGGMYPGFPGFGFGHNRHLAFGVTTLLRDGWDLVRLQRDASDPFRYQSAAGTGRIAAREERVAVRFGRPVTIAWETCDHGIIYPHWQSEGAPTVALRYAGCDHAAHFRGHRALMRAADQTTLGRALEDLADGPLDYNFVYALRSGRIGWEVLGQLPQRPADGLFVRAASDPASAWSGSVAFRDRPRLANPRCGYVVSANAVTEPRQWSMIGTAIHAEPDYRQERIRRLLAASNDHTREYMQAMQLDVASDFAPPLRDALVELLRPARLTTALQGEAWEVLAAWNGVYDRGSAGACIFHHTRRGLAARVFRALLGATSGRRYAQGQHALPRLDRLLLDGDDPLRRLLQERSGFPLAYWAGEAFERAVHALRKRLGDDLRQWRWGDLQRVRIGPVMAEVLPAASHLMALDAEFGGEPNTVSPAVSLPDGKGGLRVIAGASSRFVCDLAHPDEAWFAHSSGSGWDPFTPYHAARARDWSEGRYYRSALWAVHEVPDVIERAIVSPADIAAE
jgi:penicillin amidase